MNPFLKFIVLSLFSSICFAYNINTYIPTKAHDVIPIVMAEQLKYFPDHPAPEYFPSLIELESCISLTHSRCYSSLSQLKSERELGIGLGQITVAYNKDGSVRMDALRDMKNAHKAELKELEWSTIRNRPDLQIRTIILMIRDNFKGLYDIKDFQARIDFADAGYNGGPGGVQKERRACGLKAGCNPQLWFDNVEKICLKSKKPIYGNRSACDINRHHVYSVRYERMPKYKAYLASLKK